MREVHLCVCEFFFVESAIPKVSDAPQSSNTTMRSLLLSLRRVTLLSRHHHQQPHAFAPIRTRSIPINPTSSFPYLLRHSSSSSHPNGDDAKVAGPLVEYERRIVAGELLDGDLCQVYPSSFLHSLLILILNLVPLLASLVL